MIHMCATCHVRMQQSHITTDKRGRTWIHYICAVCRGTKKICITR